MFNEAALENAIIQSLENQGYEYVKGEDIHKELSEVLLRNDFKNYMVSNYDLTDFEINALLKKLDNYTNADLYSSNKEIMSLITEGTIIKREDKTKKDLYINFINYENPEKNIIKVVNQLEITGTAPRRPDAIIYINGLPLVVFEFKSAVKENATIKNAYEQLTIRYTRDIPELFKYNAFCVISDGVNNKCGSIFAKYEFFYAWRTTEFMGEEADGIDSLNSMISGLFNKETLIDVIHNFIYFPDKSTNRTKIVCRYPQYYAAKKLAANIKKHIKPKGDGKGGTYWGATGCGKSFTMLFLSRLLMRDSALASPTIIIITDRTDLDDQISGQFLCAAKYIGDENLIQVKTREELKNQLAQRESGGVFLTTIQKFSEGINLLSKRTNIICISDEAHRSQVNLEQRIVISENKAEKKYGFAKYLHDSLPEATYAGFTGTPIDATIDVFGDIIDRYTMTEAVEDNITGKIVYEGRASKVYLDEDKLKTIEDYYKLCEAQGANEYQIEESKKTVAKMKEIIGHPDRFDAIAVDFAMRTELEQLRFMFNAKKLKQSYNLCTSNENISSKEKDYIYFYTAVRSVIYKITKGDAPDATQMNERVRQLIQDALSSDGIEEVFQIKEAGKLTDIFSDAYLQKIKDLPLENTKVRILQRLLKQKIEEFKKVNKIKGVDFSEKMKKIIEKYNARTEIDVEKIHGETVDAIINLIDELKEEQNSFQKMGIDYEEKAFYDILKSIRDNHKFDYDDNKMIELCKEIKSIVADKTKYTDCFKKENIKAELEVDLIRLLGRNGYPPEYNKEVYKEVFEQAENFKKYSNE